MNHVEYFQSKQHENLCKSIIAKEQERLRSVVEKDGPLAGVSLCITMLSAYPTFMKMLGLQDVAVELLETALQEARKK